MSTIQDYVIDPLAVGATIALGTWAFKRAGKWFDNRKNVDTNDHNALQELISLKLPELVPVLKEVCNIMQDQPATMFKKASPGLNTRVTTLETKIDNVATDIKELLKR